MKKIHSFSHFHPKRNFHRWLPQNFHLFLLVLFLLPSAYSFGQVYECGVYQKARPDSIPAEYYTDRFGNIFLQEELEEMYKNSHHLDCPNASPFKLLIETYTDPQGNNFPTSDQEDLICAVFEYLAG